MWSAKEGQVKRRRATSRKSRKPQQTTKAKRSVASKAAPNRRLGPSALSKDTEVARLTRELAEAREQQTATSEILGAVARSSTDVQVVLDSVCQSAAQLCEAYDASIWRPDGDRLVLVSHHGPITQVESVPLARGSVIGRSVLDKQTVHIADIQSRGDEFPVTSEYARRLGFRTGLYVPLVREGVAIGVIGLRRTEKRLFTERQIVLLQTFADQAVVAIENARLLNDLRERTDDLTVALEHQTATGEILSSISDSITDAQPVFDVIVRNLRRLFDTRFAMVQVLKDGIVYLVAAGYEAEFETLRQQFPRPLDESTGSGLAMVSKQVVQFAPALANPATPPATRQFARELGFDSVIFAPMLREDKVIGVIGTARYSADPFDDKQVMLIKIVPRGCSIGASASRSRSRLWPSPSTGPRVS
jgi:two-component system NtrC family sensor kinase